MRSAGLGDFLLLLRPHLPQPDGLVGRDTGHHGLVGAGGEEEHPTGVTGEVRHLQQTLASNLGIFPDGELVLREPVPGDELLVVRVPNNARNLAARVLAGYLAASLRVPNPKQKFSLTAIG